MKIYTLVGKAGTGKSYRAMNLCREYNIDGIIDDGLFIYKSTVIEGVSAKRVETKIGAIKTALFMKDDIREKVVEAIKEKNPDSLLILGTSVDMTNHIIEKLELLGKIESEEELEKAIAAADITRIFIEDIATEEEIETAQQQRYNQGKHVIPAPALQLKSNFAGYFMSPLKSLRLLRGKETETSEKTVVRPVYSYLGEYYIKEKAIDDIIRCAADETEGVHHVIHISHVKSTPETYSLSLLICCDRGRNLWDAAMDFQQKTADMIEKMTAFNVSRIDVEIRSIYNS